MDHAGWYDLLFAHKFTNAQEQLLYHNINQSFAMASCRVWNDIGCSCMANASGVGLSDCKHVLNKLSKIASTICSIIYALQSFHMNIVASRITGISITPCHFKPLIGSFESGWGKNTQMKISRISCKNIHHWSFPIILTCKLVIFRWIQFPLHVAGLKNICRTRLFQGYSICHLWLLTCCLPLKKSNFAVLLW